jgi:hypothetical protein
MKSNWSNSAGLALMAAAVLLLAILRRLDLLLIVAPLSVLFSYRLARARFRNNSQQR